MKVAVVILNWNTGGYLKRWLPGLIAGCKGKDAEVIVADNASTDDSTGILTGDFPGIRTIRLDDNYGFTGGYNRALDQVDAEYFVLVNTDVDVPGNWLEPLIGWMDGHPECGVCGPKILALGKDGERTSEFEYAGAAGGLLDRYGYPFCRGRVLGRTETDKGQYDSPADVFWISGACMMTRRSLWRQLGGLDGRFFAHMEEIDYCWRAQLAGWKVTVVPESAVWHLGGGTLKQGSPFKLKLNFRNNLLMLDNNLAATIGVAAARRRIFVRMLADGASAVCYLTSGRSDYFRAVIDAHREFREMRRGCSAQGKEHPAGLLDVNIVLLSIFEGKNIFKRLKRYEDSH